MLCAPEYVDVLLKQERLLVSVYTACIYIVLNSPDPLDVESGHETI